jgi:hypothetical protein
VLFFDEKRRVRNEKRNTRAAKRKGKQKTKEEMLNYMEEYDFNAAKGGKVCFFILRFAVHPFIIAFSLIFL